MTDEECRKIRSTMYIVQNNGRCDGILCHDCLWVVCPAVNDICLQGAKDYLKDFTEIEIMEALL